MQKTLHLFKGRDHLLQKFAMNTCWKHLSLVCDSLCFPMKFKVGYAVACWLVCSGHYFVLWEK